MLLIDGTFSFATPFCACIFNKHSNALHFILEPGEQGTKYQYSYAGYFLLSEIIARLAGKSLDSVVTR